ncbi:MAG: HAD hydrolase family protein [Achromobacter sp.]|jgi:3-deoxy-D-manno-octulosonate 8-phosphate phosphatase (KDO 8-P phosphatase)|uniref:3-deoxy-D-manno-octulosonate 8-phosphate phosphatase KdsC n=2 Tax=Alcaligenaceae TaxID=506 RepID=A0A6J4ZSV3_9BURK|nr:MULTISPECIES: HAD hydrolase family protein [Achromobacter]MBN9640002.1 HAD hydrolase family protein [Achromobacter sp.]MCG2596689.1 HAD hydrolase family protein [Achromobacter sp.]MCG2602472.1 HAD hydrolase family protein [Achromobacter sp.]CAB3632068.1 3-deoxy-D-manno-octulosonate 8-phosphate phosphatase KdsC [Achromobacter insuavis]CAB3861493.1 3-deoxy-D-manno-octulosonate 8-phosphate phosphatase KdsC [Achromobacter insuavis]
MTMTLPSSITHPAEALVLARIAPAVRERAAAVRLMVFDVDGVLTDGGLYYGETGEVQKRFHALDGHGLRLLMEGGLKVALMTGRSGPIVARRAAELGISEIMQGVRDKGTALAELAQRSAVQLNQTGYMGDDIIDLPAMQRAGFAASVPNAPGYVSQAAHWIATQPGGNGAVRECCDLLLASQGRLGGFLAAPGLLGPGAIQ